MKNNMLFLLLFLIPIGVGAQQVSHEETTKKKKEINALKLSEEVVYAEVIELVTNDDEAISLAQQKSIDKLQASVIESCARKMNMSKEDVKEIFDVIDDKCQNVVIEAGDMLRVFSYIAKDAVGLGRKKPKQKDIDRIFGETTENQVAEVKAQPAEKVEVQQEVLQNSVIPETKVETKVVAQEVKKEEEIVVIPAPVVASLSAAKTQTAQPSENPVVKTTTKPVEVSVQAATPAPEPVVVSKPAPVVEVKVPALCQTMFEKKNMTELLKYLRSEKDYQHLMFGNFNSMQYPEKCYIVILDRTSREIITILDKGESDRMNFVSKQLDRFNNYRGGNYSAIFVQEY